MGNELLKSRSESVALFHEGENYEAYNFFGVHRAEEDGVSGALFRVYAPSAKSVRIVGDFNGWNVNSNYMHCEDGIWEIFLPQIEEFSLYKYVIEHADGRLVFKADPYAFFAETDGASASKVYFIDDGFAWDDDDWMAERENAIAYTSPVNIYEVHLGSWKRYEDGNCFDYKKLADELIPYVKSMGYTHIEIMPVTEYPFVGSWGYQVTGYFAVTSRYGTPDGFKYLVNKAHKAGVGILLDWVPAHFPKDEFGLIEFDGSYLYEDADPLKMEHKGWGTRCFDFGKGEVQSFLVSSAMMFLKEYHVDGLRVDAVAAMLYLDYDRGDGQWRPNENGGTENIQAIAFLQKLNHAVGTRVKGAVMIAEESTAWPMVTMPPSDGGLGFHYKWNMGWMNDTLSYVSMDPYFRKDNHNKLNFPLVYAFSENFILPISHDEVVHGKKSLLDKMPGEYDAKFDALRAFLIFMLASPGKKIMFMGQEFGQFIEWRYYEQLEWKLLDFDKHKKTLEYFREANNFYLKYSQMWELDSSWDGFKWINADDAEHNVLSFRRINQKGKELIFIINFSPVRWENYWVGVPENKEYKVLFNSNLEKYGGSGEFILEKLKTIDGDCNGFSQHVELDLPGNSAIVLE
ncbi:MAG: 1,4-alpha-glucan branching protein GlgB [Eubacterium sp.]|nr:1,4-alpha-glucan branching protein GlgB [Eubacterium sp.]